MESMRFEDKVVLVSGAARGQGRAHAVAFAREGARVAVFDIASQIATVPYDMGTEAQLTETARLVEAEGRDCLRMLGDVRSSADALHVVNETIDRFGQLDVLVANAGIVSYAPFAEMTDDMWTDMIDVDLTGPFKLMRAVAPHMLERRFGRIVATTSMAGRVGMPNLAHYCAAKWGVIGLVKTASQELSPHGITVNAIAPANVDTEMIQNPPMYKLFAPGVENPTREDAVQAFLHYHTIPVPWVDPSVISDAAVFLASNEAKFITGEVLHVAAGMNSMNAA